MPSVIDLCNSALDKVGQGAITSLSDGTKSAKLCNRNWPLVRDRVLRSHPWNFAVKRTTLAASETAPDWGYTAKFPIPTDCLRILEVRDLSTDEFQIENGHIHANATLPEGERVVVRFALPTSGNLVQCSAVVGWARHRASTQRGRAAFGLEFVDPPEALTEAVQRYAELMQRDG